MKHLNDMDRMMIGAKLVRAFENDGAYYNADLLDKAIARVEKNWEIAKSERLFKLFGDKLMVTKKISIEKDANQIAREICNLYHSFIMKLNSAVGRAHYDGAISSDLSYRLSNMISCSVELATNRITEPFEVAVAGHKPFKVSKGQKTLKVLQKLGDIFEINPELFEDFRIKHSQILNDKKIEGTLTLSIHPLDYMTMSDNANGWDSCMSWDNQGCYRAGTLECMNCPSTIVAYIASGSKEVCIGVDNYGERVYWNSKKYRQLVMIDDNAIMTNKGYPFQNDNLSRAVLDFVAELAGSDYDGEDYSLDDYESYTVEGLRGVDLETRCHMYNDMGNGARAQFRLNKNFTPLVNGYIYMELGGDAHCLLCDCYVDDAETLYCYNCCDGNMETCDCCGERVHEEDAYWVDDEVLCRDCFVDQTSMCEYCEECHYTDNMTYLHLEETKDYEDRNGEHPIDGYYCHHCFNYNLTYVGRDEEDEEEEQ